MSARLDMAVATLRRVHQDGELRSLLESAARTVAHQAEAFERNGDPLRDLGPLLWWYAPPSRWGDLLHGYGLHMTPELAEPIYWWAAVYSLDIAAGLLERGYQEDAPGYLEDFLAAASSRPNPRPRWAGALSPR